MMPLTPSAGAAHQRARRLVAWATAASTFAIIFFACADEGEPEGATDARDASTDASDASVDAAPTEAAKPDASRCSAAKVCITTIPIPKHVYLTSVWGSSAESVWAVGALGTVLHYDGASWEKVEIDIPDGAVAYTMRGVWLERPDDVWITDGPRIRHTTGWQGPTATKWETYTSDRIDPLPSGIRGHGSTIWLGRSVTYFVGEPIVKFNGWSDVGPIDPQTYGPSGFASVEAIAIARPDEVWAAGTLPTATSTKRSRVFRMSLGTAGDGGGDAGEADAATAAEWQAEEFDSRTLEGLHGVWGDDAATWLVGEGGLLRRVTRADVPKRVFEIMSSPVTADLHGIFGFGPNDLWVVGEASTVLHWNGTAWTKLSTPFDDATEKPRLLAVWGSSPSDLWLVGQGTMLHVEGTP